LDFIAMVVPEMMNCGAPALLILLMVMLNFHEGIPQQISLQFVELFSGMGCVSLGLLSIGMKGTSHDIALSSLMDLTTTSGFLLALNEVRRIARGGLLWLGLCCNSFSKMSRGTHGRDFWRPLGNCGYGFVAVGNLLACRCILLIYVAVSRGLKFILEQPDGSSLPLHPRWEELLGHVQIFSCSFWMGAIGGATAKRHRLWSNCKSLLMEVDRRAGYLSREDMLKLPGGPLVRHYIDQNGKKRHAGIPGKLRDSQHYSLEFGQLIADLVSKYMTEEIPAPKSPVLLDWSRSDAELFKDHFVLDGDNRKALGDLWHDAELPRVVQYLAKIRDMKPRGSWADILKFLDLRHIG